MLDAAAARTLACWLTRDLRVHFHHRRDVGRVWAADHEGRPLTVNPWSFRAWSRDGVAHLFVDETETRASATWLLLHELAHLDLAAARLLFRAFRAVPRPDGYLTTDEGHEAHPEEKMSNLVATTLLPQLGFPACSFDRLWWRARVRRMRPGLRAGSSVRRLVGQIPL